MTDLKLAIFDMDGLMFDTERIMHSAYIEAGNLYNYKFDDSVFAKTTGASSKRRNKILIDTFGKDFPLEKVLSYKEKKFKDTIHKYGVPIKPGLIELMDFFKENKIKIAVASSSKRNVVEYNVHHAGVYDNIDYIISGEELNESKPNPEIFLKPCEFFNIHTDNAIVMEDSTNGLIAAIRAHIKPIWIPDLIQIPDDVKDKLFAQAKDLSQVIDIVKKKFK
ncbi:HAD family hydrolase [Clostridium tyrobutyricum]|uniref:HAD family hydrolase n=1 Tax=Clostridium tyrobutyricum TaxID=1519 RepID=UPI001C39005C|nr:HAD family phosphatase [Clostridium tyrobutyricum]MBV4415786.1 HAD-IA family hydrolase [Clostridium tyrobutyricum]